MNEKEILLTSLLNCKRSDLYCPGGISLSLKQAARLASAQSKRSQGFPLQYILGETEFYGLPFKVDEKVFIPRPETEILVEAALRQLSLSPALGCGSYYKILDIGTGSGCIAISLAKNLNQAYIVALDISSCALDVARENARLNRVSERICFLKVDFFKQPEITGSQGQETIPHENSGCPKFKSLGDSSKAYDMIVSNPPYIASGDLEYLQDELRYEPLFALDGKEEGIIFYPLIIKEASRLLKKEGLLLMEMGLGQCEKIKNMFQESGNFEITDVINDYCGIERVIAARSKVNSL